jgi:hypothetical protein
MRHAAVAGLFVHPRAGHVQNGCDLARIEKALGALFGMEMI